MRRNPTKDLFDAGEVALGGWLSMPTSVSAESMAALDLDYINGAPAIAEGKTVFGGWRWVF